MSTAQTGAAPAVPNLARLALILGAATASVPIAVDMYLPALPTIEREFAVSAARVQQTIAIFFIGMSIAQFGFGPLSDRIGRRAPIFGGLALYVLAGFGCALSANIGQLLAFRFLEALGGAVGMVVGRAVARDYFSGVELAKLLSLITLVMGLAPILAPLAGSAVLAFAHWRAVFWILGGFGLFVITLVLAYMPESLPPEKRIRGGFGATLSAMGQVVSSRHFLGYALTGSLSSGVMFAWIASSPFIVVKHFGYSEQVFGLTFGAMAVALISGSQVNVRLLRRWKPDQILRWTTRVQPLAAILVLASSLASDSLWALLVPLLFLIATTGLTNPNAMASALTPFGAMAGSASAVTGMFHGLSGALSSSLVGVVPGSGTRPMAIVMVIVSLASFSALTFLARPTETIAVART